jgi:hypothetical protein
MDRSTEPGVFMRATVPTQMMVRALRCGVCEGGGATTRASGAGRSLLISSEGTTLVKRCFSRQSDSFSASARSLSAMRYTTEGV